MSGRTVLATLPGQEPGQRLEVGLAQTADGRLMVDLREQNYAEGIGWFDQKTLTLDPRQLRMLQGVLGSKATELREFETRSPATIPFPGPAERVGLRAASGDESPR